MSLTRHFTSLLNHVPLFILPKPVQLLPVIGCTVSSPLIKSWDVQRHGVHTSAVVERARKGTKARRDAIKKAQKKKKIEQEVKKGWTPFHQRQKSQDSTAADLPNYRWKKWPPQDDVYVSTFFRWPEHTVAEAVAKLRDTHQPTMYNSPDAQVLLSVNVNLTTDKAKRFISDVSGTVLLPHSFKTGQSHSVAVLTECEETRTKVRDMGVQLVGGKEIVKLVLGGEVELTSYDFIVSSLDILPELVPLRGLLKKKFPAPNNGTAASDVVGAANRFLTGVSYDCVKPLNVRTHGDVTVPFGTLSMEDEHLTANALALLKDIDSHRKGHKSANLIDFAYVRCHTTNELFVLDHYTFLGIERPRGEEGTEEQSQETEASVAQMSN